MSIRNLDALFRPGSVAVIGASSERDSVGAMVMRNLLRAGFPGPVMPVNPKHRAVAGVLAYPDAASLPETPDLAVLCTPAATVPGLVGELGARGTRAAVVLTAGLARIAPDDAGASLQQQMLDAARPHGLRLLGPNCLGLMVPELSLDATFAHMTACPGRLAFVSQSGALCTAVLDWARGHDVGFSHFVSLGNSADVDVGDVLDYLALEPSARAILLYLESLTHARKFMSAARAASRNKPVLVVKAGRMEEGARAAASHTGALAGADDVYDAAFRRAGMLRVVDIDELFDAAETLARMRRPAGSRLAILTNGGGPGVMATDAYVAGGGPLAELSEATLDRLDQLLPETWSRSNPVDIIGDASGERYAAAYGALTRDENVDAILVLHAPTALAPSEAAARAVADAVAASERKPTVLAAWLGAASAVPGRRVLREAGVPTFATPEDAVRAFLQMRSYRRNQELLMETPPSLPEAFVPRVGEARRILDAALADGRRDLSESEAKRVLDAYEIPIVETRVASNASQAVALARELGFPVALKILSPDVGHKSDVGGVALDLESPEAVGQAAAGMLRRVGELRPDAKIEGFTVQPMARRPGAVELIVGLTTDPIFGPVVLFGSGGTATEVIRDRALGLPPLNPNLARELVAATRVSRLLAGYRDRPAADAEAIDRALVAVSQIAIDLPEVAELDVNPLLADGEGVLALDARIRLVPVTGGADRLAIRPYPEGLEETVRLAGGERVLLRPIRPEDEPAHREFFERLDPEDVRLRFFGVVRTFEHSQLARFTQIDYDREMAFVAVGKDARTLGVVRAICDPDNQRAEFAVIVRSDHKGRGLGRALMEKIIRYCRERGTAELVGSVLWENRAMLRLAERLGFASRDDGQGTVVVRLPLGGG